MKKNASYNELLRHENEITKLKLQAEYGMQLSGSNEKLNPEIEKIWLDQILEYERALADHKTKKIGELLENPVCVPVEEISDEDIPEKLREVMELLRTKNIVIESIDGASDREMYRFITQELFQEETDIGFPKNMITCFIYEEFYPNDEADIKRHSVEFINLLAKKDSNYYERFIVTDQGEEEKEINSVYLKRKLELFRDAFDEIRIDEFEIKQISVNDIKADIIFIYKISLLPPHSNTFQIISGTGRFDLINENDYWVIERIEMKGVL